MSILCNIDDKHVPIYRILWVSSLPHFCGEDDCIREGYYEIRLEQGESLWATSAEQSAVCEKLERWQGGLDAPE